ncbi:hypothetical protein ACFX2J_017704 [Malus domestica]
MGPRPVDLKISTWYQSQEAGSYCHVIGCVPFGPVRCPRRLKMPRVWNEPSARRPENFHNSTATRLRRLAENCSFFVEIDLSNDIELTGAAAKAVAEVKNLEKLMLARCKLITDIGIGYVDVGWRKLRLLCLR